MCAHMYIYMYEKQKDTHQSPKSDCLQERELGVRVRSRSCTLTLYIYTIANYLHSTYSVPGTILGDLQILTYLIIRTVCTNINTVQMKKLRHREIVSNLPEVIQLVSSRTRPSGLRVWALNHYIMYQSNTITNKLCTKGKRERVFSITEPCSFPSLHVL